MMFKVNKMTRDDPLLLPVCQSCGEYKGVGECRNPSCSGSDNGKKIAIRYTNQKCTICGQSQVVTCIQCGTGYCETHSVGAELNNLGSFHQRIGTCVECNHNVCEKCWILNPNGDIVCLVHLEKDRESH